MNENLTNMSPFAFDSSNNNNNNNEFKNFNNNFTATNYYNYLMSDNEREKDLRNTMTPNTNQRNFNKFNQIQINNYNSNEQIASSFNAQYNYFATWCLSPSARMEFNHILNNQPIYNVNYNKYGYDGDESYNKGLDKTLFRGKYTCKFEIQIENDNEFQISRRLIGSKVF